MARRVSNMPGTLKSVQRGTISISGAASATATVAAVDTSKSELRHLGSRVGSVSGCERDYIEIVLTNSTTITATRGNSVSGTPGVVSWELLEYH